MITTEGYNDDLVREFYDYYDSGKLKEDLLEILKYQSLDHIVINSTYFYYDISTKSLQTSYTRNADALFVLFRTNLTLMSFLKVDIERNIEILDDLLDDEINTIITNYNEFVIKSNESNLWEFLLDNKVRPEEFDFISILNSFSFHFKDYFEYDYSDIENLNYFLEKSNKQRFLDNFSEYLSEDKNILPFILKYGKENISEDIFYDTIIYTLLNKEINNGLQNILIDSENEFYTPLKESDYKSYNIYINNHLFEINDYNFYKMFNEIHISSKDFILKQVIRYNNELNRFEKCYDNIYLYLPKHCHIYDPEFGKDKLINFSYYKEHLINDHYIFSENNFVSDMFFEFLEKHYDGKVKTNKFVLERVI